MLRGKRVIGVNLMQIWWISEIALDDVARRRILGNIFDFKFRNFFRGEKTKVTYWQHFTLRRTIQDVCIEVYNV